jgi:hypothetical protein
MGRELDMTIRIEMRSVYGEWKAYPACPDARIFADMLGTRTLTDHALSQIMRLGYRIETVQPEISRVMP